MRNINKHTSQETATGHMGKPLGYILKTTQINNYNMKDFGILKKYGIILIIFFFIKRILTQTLMPLYFKYIEIDPVTKFKVELHQTIVYLLIFICNLILVFVLLRDIKKGFPLRWLIIGLTILYAEVGIVFFLITYLFNDKIKNVA